MSMQDRLWYSSANVRRPLRAVALEKSKHYPHEILLCAEYEIPEVHLLCINSQSESVVVIRSVCPVSDISESEYRHKDSFASTTITNETRYRRSLPMDRQEGVHIRLFHT